MSILKECLDTDTPFQKNKNLFIYSSSQNYLLKRYLKKVMFIRYYYTLQINSHEDDLSTVALADDSSQILYSAGDDGLIKVNFEN